MFSTYTDDNTYVVIDENAVIDMISGVGIPKEHIKLYYGMHDLFDKIASMMVIEITDKISTETYNSLKSILENKFQYNDAVYSFQLEEYLGLPQITIEFYHFMFIDED